MGSVKVGTHAPGLLASPVRRDIVDTLANLPHSPSATTPFTRREGMTAGDLAERLGLHVTTIRFHVDRLVDAGMLVSRDERGTIGRPRKYYAVSPGRISDVPDPDAYRALAEILADAMVDGRADGRPVSAEDAGERCVRRHADEFVPRDLRTLPARTPGGWLTKIGVLVDLLERWGYAPEVHTADAGHTAEINLLRCPLRDLALANPAVACGVHRGLVRGALDLLGEPDSTLKVVPFLEPELCVARVTTPTAFSRQGGTS